MNKKMILFIAILVAFLVFQAKVIVPFAKDIASSSLFLEDSGDYRDDFSSKNTMTDEAYSQCNAYIANELLPEYTFKFAEEPKNEFSLGNYQYVINADIEIIPTNAASFTRRYVCRIKYLHDDNDNTDLADSDNWSIDGFSGLDNI